MDRSLVDIPRSIEDSDEMMDDNKQYKPINNKKRCGVFLGLLSLSLLLIVPIVSVTLYQFVTCFERNNKLILEQTLDSSVEVSHLDSTVVKARNSIEYPRGENGTNNLNDGNYDPFFHKSKLSNSEEMIESNMTNSWMDDKLCILNFFGLFFAFFITMIILVLVVGVSFA